MEIVWGERETIRGIGRGNRGARVAEHDAVVVC